MAPPTIAESADRRDQQQPVGLAFLAGDLGEELGAGDADGDRETDPVAYLLPQPPGDLHRCARHPAQPGDIEKRLVHRQRFDQGSGVFKDSEDLSTRLRVRGHPRWHDDGPRAERTGLMATHRRPYAEGLRLVTGRQHHPGAHDHRPAAQRRVVPLLHRRVERVEVGVEDGRLARDARHEHMFARRGDKRQTAVP
jgi:hypothetical protein